ncbi:hypothetical protein C8Q76DRAFT_800393 [Earliella scabrosa]|nr:hypothetical protein C8Q76DRAFT_800393 [Earliella scabrosa]
MATRRKRVRDMWAELESEAPEDCSRRVRARSATSPSQPPSTQADGYNRSPSTSPSRPVGEGYSSDEAKRRSDGCSSPVGPVGEYSDSECAGEGGPAAVAPVDVAGCPSAGSRPTPPRNQATPSNNEGRASSSPIGPVGEGSSSSPTGLVGEGSSSSPIGPVGEGWTSDAESSQSSGAVGRGSNGFRNGSPPTAEERRPPPQLPQRPPRTPTRPTLSTLNAERSPTPVPNPHILAATGSATTSSSQYRTASPAEDLIAAKSTIDWFEAELRLLKKAADVCSQTPSVRISSRSEFWAPYNRLLGGRGIYYQQMWLDHTYKVE